MATSEYPPVVYGVPSRDGNGFKAGMCYRFEHVRNGLYRTTVKEGWDRFECYPFGERSAHLWDGVNWLAAGHFRED